MEVKGKFTGYFETGTEGTIWAIQNEQHPEQDSVSSLVWLEDHDYVTFRSPVDGEVMWEGAIRLAGLWEIERHPYLRMYIKHHGNREDYPKQLNLAGRWIHSLPTNCDLGLWALIFLDISNYEFLGSLRR